MADKHTLELFHRRGRYMDEGHHKKIRDALTTQYQKTPEIVKKTGLNRNTVRNHLDFLKRRGVVERTGTEVMLWRLKKDVRM